MTSTAKPRDVIQPVIASREARHAYWRTHGPGGNRADAELAADEAYNVAVLAGPESWRDAYPLRQSGE